VPVLKITSHVLNRAILHKKWLYNNSKLVIAQVHDKKMSGLSEFPNGIF
jgi:hypothetical protein